VIDPRKSTAREDSLQAGELACGLPLLWAFVSQSAVSYGKKFNWTMRKTGLLSDQWFVLPIHEELPI
jgi:hypothetical protein